MPLLLLLRQEVQEFAFLVFRPEVARLVGSDSSSAWGALRMQIVPRPRRQRLVLLQHPAVLADGTPTPRL